MESKSQQKQVVVIQEPERARRRKAYAKPTLQIFGKLHLTTQKSGGNIDGKAAKKA